MPGPYIHISSMKHTSRGLASEPYRPIRSSRINPGWTGRDTQQLGQLMIDHPNFAALGAIGPDLFFFLPDFRDEDGIVISSFLVKALSFLEDLSNALDPYISKYEHYLGPIDEDTAEELSRLTGGLSEQVGDILGDLASIVITAFEDLAVQQWDFWSFFSYGLNKGYDEKAFFYSDMLHLRETDQFAQSLLQEADKLDDDAARAYAAGFITHVGTDVLGHPFVNSICGAPYRLRFDWHHAEENQLDSHWYLMDPLSPGSGDQYPQLTESALYYDVAFRSTDNGPMSRPAYPTGDTLRDRYTRERTLEIDSSLPDSVANVLLNAITDVFYSGQPHPKILRDNDGKPSADLIKEAYDLLFRYLKMTTVDGFAHEPPPPPDVFPNLDFPTISDPNPDPPGESDGGSFWDDLLDFILSVVAVIEYIVEVAVYLATLPWAVLADLITYPFRLALYYCLELPLFHLLKELRAILVMTGYLMPMKDEIATGFTHIGMPNSVTWHSVLLGLSDVFGDLNAAPPSLGDEPYRDKAGYPHYHPADDLRHPWEYPTSHIEWMYPGSAEVATACPYAQGTPVEILFADVMANPEIRDALEGAMTPQAADAVGQQLGPSKHLGDVVSFSKYLVWLASRDSPQKDGTEVPLVDWNLDSDRGYGYHCWDWNRDAQAPPLSDPEGNPYQPPCTPPQQAPGWNPDTPLQLHWTGPGLSDPGCWPSTPPPIELRPAHRVRRTGRGGRQT